MGSLQQGGKADPTVDQLPDDLIQKFQVVRGVQVMEIGDLTRLLMPSATEHDVSRLARALNLEWVSLIPVVDPNKFFGILAIGKVLHVLEQEAVGRLMPRFAKALAFASVVDDSAARVKGLQTLQRVLLSVSSTADPDQLLERVLDHLADVVAFDGARIYVLSENQIELKVTRGSLRKASWQSIDVGDGDLAFGHAIHTGEAKLISGVR